MAVAVAAMVLFEDGRTWASQPAATVAEERCRWGPSLTRAEYNNFCRLTIDNGSYLDNFRGPCQPMEVNIRAITFVGSA
jgi:hypothetical protein